MDQSDRCFRSSLTSTSGRGFPCQDYSVAKTLRQAHGLVGKKGVLWWEIHRLLRIKLETGRPIRHLFLENVDRLIKSPTSQRGRDFAVCSRRSPTSAMKSNGES